MLIPYLVLLPAAGALVAARPAARVWVLFAVGFTAYGRLHRRTLAVTLLVGYVAAVAILLARLVI